MSTAVPAAVCTTVSFVWPDGRSVLEEFSATFPRGRTGMIGVNGSGKSTLLRLIAGRLQPSAGSVTVHGRLGYLPQDVSLATDLTVADVLGVSEMLTALRAIESGDARELHFETIGTQWDVAERSRAVLDQLGLEQVGLDRMTCSLSGGESTLLAVAAQVLQGPDVLLLDEPTNNLDHLARERLYATVRAWPGSMIVVSHDRALLGLVDQIADLRGGQVHVYGGPWEDYEAAVAAEQEAAERKVRVAEQDLRRQRRELVEAHTKLDRRRRYGKKMQENKREPKVVMNSRERQAQVSAAKHRTMHEGKVADAEDRLTSREQELIDEPEIRIDLPDTQVPAGRQVLSLTETATRCQSAVDLLVQGPERIALTGRNGSGKTTLLETITGRLQPLAGQVQVHVPARHLPQRLNILDPHLSVAQNVARLAPGATDNEVRARLARFLFRGRRADQAAGTLSGGERFRASIAALLLAEPAPQLLLLDEPTNNLDLASVAEFTQALVGYRGALIVASHDYRFLREIGVTRWLTLDHQLREGDPP